MSGNTDGENSFQKLLFVDVICVQRQNQCIYRDHSYSFASLYYYGTDHSPTMGRRLWAGILRCAIRPNSSNYWSKLNIDVPFIGDHGRWTRIKCRLLPVVLRFHGNRPFPWRHRIHISASKLLTGNVVKCHLVANEWLGIIIAIVKLIFCCSILAFFDYMPIPPPGWSAAPSSVATFRLVSSQPLFKMETIVWRKFRVFHPIFGDFSPPSVILWTEIMDKHWKDYCAHLQLTAFLKFQLWSGKSRQILWKKSSISIIKIMS